MWPEYTPVECSAKPERKHYVFDFRGGDMTRTGDELRPRKRYVGLVIDGAVAVRVQLLDPPRSTYPLAYDGRYPDLGFTWGCEGRTTQELARCILADHLGTSDPDLLLCQAFTRALLAPVPLTQALVVRSEDIDAWLEKQEVAVDG